MGSYELDKEGYLHYTGDGWIQTKEPLTEEEIRQFKEGELSGWDVFQTHGVIDNGTNNE